jgi:Tol biopolymer transport system component
LAAGCALALLLAGASAPVSVADARFVTSSVNSMAFPGQNGRIAFVSDRDGPFDVYAMDPAGGNVTRLTTSDDREDFPVWSPGGTRLAYAAGPFGEQNIFVMKADGSGVTQLTDAPGRDYEPAWSPDGTKILFASDRGRAAGSPQVYVMNADGSGETLLVSAPVGGSARSPIWSPEGDRIAYAWNDSGPVGDTMFVAAPDGSSATAVTGIPAALEGIGELDWSPDGSRIVFVGTEAGSIDLYDAELEGGAVTQLTEDGDAGAPAWSPDGQLITFTRFGLNSGESAVVEDVWVVDADGSGQAQLTPADDFTDRQPTWQSTHAPTLVLTVTPGSAQREVGEEHTLRFTPTDVTGTPVGGQDLIVEVTGSHPQTATITSRGDGRATFTWVGTGPGTDTVGACADNDGSGACSATEPRVTATVLWGTIDEDEEPRLAFTDDADALYAVDIEREETSEGGESYLLPDPPTSYATNLAGYEAGPKHEGEAGGTPGQAPAFVSTRDDPNGEVYLAFSSNETRVTCDPGIETHPVVNTEGAVAYASNADGDWDIYVSVPPPVILNRSAASRKTPRVAASGRATGPRADVITCSAGWTTTNVTDTAPGTDELWPTWTYTRENTDTGIALTPSGLVFSRAFDGTLPDLYLVEAADGFSAPPRALTNTPDFAESQPAAMTFAIDEIVVERPVERAQIAAQTWVAFTTTQFRPEGTIAFLSPETTPGPPPVVNDPRLNDVQASDPAWSSTVNPGHLAFASRQDDPFGSIGIAQVEDPDDEGAGTTEPDVVDFGILSDGFSGIGESHPFWAREFGSETDDDASLVYTSRSRDGVAAGSRNLDADVSDVLALDGSQRRVILRQRDLAGGTVERRYDEAGPSYSPDGRRLVYSRNARPATEVAGSRLLMVANADGSGPALLLPGSQRQGSDRDFDPAWSPDGTRIAFVRIRGPGGAGSAASEIWVYDLTTGVASRIPAPPDGADLSPSWAPDSQHLVVARSRDDRGGPYDAARRWGTGPVAADPEVFILDANDPTGPGVAMDYCFDLCRPLGRTPAWSPDGSRIVYEAEGQLRLITLPGPCCTDPELDIDPPAAVTGFELSGDGDPTESAPFISVAHDPTWSPDGNEIAFAGQLVGQPDQSGIWGIVPDGRGLRLITDEPGPETEPAYQPIRAADVAVTVSVANSPAQTGDPVVATFTVTNNGPAPAAEVALDTTFTAGALLGAPAAPPGCRSDGSGCGFALLAAGESRVYQVSIRHQVAVLGVATGTVVAENPDPLGSNNTASAPYRVEAADVQVRVKLDEKVGYVGGPRVATVTVRNIGTNPVEDVRLTTTWPDLVLPGAAPPLPSFAPVCVLAGDACDLGTIAAGGEQSFRVALQPLNAGTARIRAKVETSTPEVPTDNNRDSVDLQIRQPTIRVLPSVGPPGQVVLVYCENMPPTSEISLAWAPGISVDTGPFEVSKDGTVRRPLLIVRHDQIGTRLLTATSTTALFTPVDGVMLVVPGTLVPPNFNGRS